MRGPTENSMSSVTLEHVSDASVVSIRSDENSSTEIIDLSSAIQLNSTEDAAEPDPDGQPSTSREARANLQAMQQRKSQAPEQGQDDAIIPGNSGVQSSQKMSKPANLENLLHKKLQGLYTKRKVLSKSRKPIKCHIEYLDRQIKKTTARLRFVKRNNWKQLTKFISTKEARGAAVNSMTPMELVDEGGLMPSNEADIQKTPCKRIQFWLKKKRALSQSPSSTKVENQRNFIDHLLIKLAKAHNAKQQNQHKAVTGAAVPAEAATEATDGNTSTVFHDQSNEATVDNGEEAVVGQVVEETHQIESRAHGEEENSPMISSSAVHSEKDGGGCSLKDGKEEVIEKFYMGKLRSLKSERRSLVRAIKRARVKQAQQSRRSERQGVEPAQWVADLDKVISEKLKLLSMVRKKIQQTTDNLQKAKELKSSIAAFRDGENCAALASTERRSKGNPPGHINEESIMCMPLDNAAIASVPCARVRYLLERKRFLLESANNTKKKDKQMRSLTKTLLNAVREYNAKVANRAPKSENEENQEQANESFAEFNKPLLSSTQVDSTGAPIDLTAEGSLAPKKPCADAEIVIDSSDGEGKADGDGDDDCIMLDSTIVPPIPLPRVLKKRPVRLPKLKGKRKATKASRTEVPKTPAEGQLFYKDTSRLNIYNVNAQSAEVQLPAPLKVLGRAETKMSDSISSVEEGELQSTANETALADLDDSVIFLSEERLPSGTQVPPIARKRNGNEFISLHMQPIPQLAAAPMPILACQQQSGVLAPLPGVNQQNQLRENNNNAPNPCPGQKPTSNKRMVIIDGSNVAYGHSHSQLFSVRGIQIAIEYFERMGHDVKAVVPQYRINPHKSSDPELLRSLHANGKIVLTPCKNLPNQATMSYDDRVILQLACELDAAVVSNDNYRDLMFENPQFKQIIENRVIGFAFCNDFFVVPSDPYGRWGPDLNTILHFRPETSGDRQPLPPLMPKAAGTAKAPGWKA